MRIDRALKDKLPLINENIRSSQVQLITHEGNNIGVVSRSQALQMAQEVNLDLVVISQRSSGDTPVVKIMDFGKSLYEKKKKQAEAKKHQKVIQVKEIKIRPKISENDYQTKMKRAMQFLRAGKRLKVSLFFRGRENITKHERGPELFAKVDKTLEEHGLLKDLVQEKGSRVGQSWSKIYYLKSA